MTRHEEKQKWLIAGLRVARMLLPVAVAAGTGTAVSLGLTAECAGELGDLLRRLFGS